MAAFGFGLSEIDRVMSDPAGPDSSDLISGAKLYINKESVFTLIIILFMGIFIN